LSAQNLPSILQISTYEVAGGAEALALSLFHSYHKRGYQSYLAVGRKASNDPNVFVIPNDECRTGFAGLGIRFGRYLLSANYPRRLVKAILILTQPKRYVETFLGIENFDFPGTYQLLNLPPEQLDVIHAHNLHVDYFDLRALPWLGRQKPMFISLHDAWLFSGHCAHSFSCDRWKTGCGRCPDLTIYPSVNRDATAYNWKRKQQIYAKSHLHVAAPSQWLMKKLEQSILMPAVVQARHIPYGVDLSVFQPGSKSEARRALNIALDSAVILLRANSVRKDPWKDYRLMWAVIDILSKREDIGQMIFMALGEDRPAEHHGKVELRFIPYQSSIRSLVKYYQAADLYIHPARADTFPLAVLEALACATPVIATAVGGIPEQIIDGVTGFLTSPGDSKPMVDSILRLLGDSELRFHMGKNAVEDARLRFDHERQVNDYLDWYQETLDSWPTEKMLGM